MSENETKERMRLDKERKSQEYKEGYDYGFLEGHQEGIFEELAEKSGYIYRQEEVLDDYEKGYRAGFDTGFNHTNINNKGDIYNG